MLMRSGRTFKLVLVVLIALFGGSRGSFALNPDRTLTQALHRIWQVSQGLPQATIYCALQSRSGYLWLGTQGGLVRFDGVRFTSVGPSQFWVRDLVEDNEGALWAGTDGSGLVRWNNGVITSFSIGEGLPSASVSHLFFSDSNGILWICTPGGLARFDRGKLTVYRTSDGLPTDRIRGICRTPDGKIWVGGEGTQLAVFDGLRFTLQPLGSIPPNASIRSLLSTSDGTIWIGTTSGLVRLKDGLEKRFTVVDGLADDGVDCLARGRDGTLWIGTKDGFTRYRDGELESFRVKDGLSQSTVYTLLEDHEGSLWAGTKHGLNQFLDRRTVPFTVSEGLASNDTGPVIQDSGGNIWVGTLDAGLSHFDGKRFSVVSTRQGLPSNAIRALADGGGGLWVGTDGGLSLLRRNRVEKNYTTADGLASNDVRCLFRDAEGTLWVGTAAGAASLKNDVIERLPGVGRMTIIAMLRSRDGVLYFSSDDGRIYRYRDQKPEEIARQAISRGEVDSFHEDKDGLIWMGTVGGGLSVWDHRALFRYSMRDGLFDDEIFGIVGDDRDRLWMACSKGIFNVSRSDLRKFAAGELKRVVSAPFSPTDALRTIECKSGVQPAAWRMGDGRLWFSTIRGVIVVDPGRLARKLPAPPVVVEEVAVNGKREVSSEIERLPPGVKNLEFHYTALSYLVPTRITFRYKLEGFDRDWVEAGTRHEAYYTNLPPGKYRFRVAALNVDGTLTEAANPAVFALAPYFYQRGWFIPSCIVAAALLAWMVFGLRVRRIKAGLVAIVAERSRIARELHDTLLQGFSGVTMEMQALSARLPSSAERTTLEEIIRDAATCMSEARRSVAGLRGSNGSDSGLSAAIERAAKQITETRDVRLKLDLTRQAPRLAADVEYHLLRIAAEAVSNSVRHSGARNIEVSLDCAGRMLSLAVRDDGNGFTRGNGGGREHYGLIGMEERAKQIGADFKLRTAPNMGTSVLVELRRDR